MPHPSAREICEVGAYGYAAPSSPLLVRYSSPSFHTTVNRAAWRALVTSLVPRPRPTRPCQPSVSRICCAASRYVIVVSDVWRT